MTNMPPLEKKTGHKVIPKNNMRLITALVLILFVTAIIILMRYREAAALSQSTQEASVANVIVIKAQSGPAVEEIVLPGNVLAWHETPIYARTSGYLKSWNKDIGNPVKAGEIIAEIDTPEVDAQFHQAEADLKVAEVNAKFSKDTSDRWQKLLQSGSVSKQDAEDKASTAAANAASVASQKANLDHLRELEVFKRITAPFDGIITSRNVDDGALIGAGNSGVGPELFHIAETDKLRVYVQVPELYGQSITPDLTAELRFDEHPGVRYPAKLTNNAGAFEPTSRSLQLEFEADNEKGELLPGGYAQVHLNVPSSSSTLRLPVNTLLFRGDGLQVATIDSEGHALLKTITLGRDYGKEVEVRSGLEVGELVIVNPPDSLVTGQSVHVVTPGQKPKEN